MAAEEATPFLVEPKPSEADLAEDEVLEVLDLVRGGMAVVGGLRRAGGDRACQEAGRGGAGRVRGAWWYWVCTRRVKSVLTCY